MSVNLREYQINDMENVRKAFREGYRSVLLVAPTGSGKTTTASAIIRGAMQKGKRITFLAHRRELVNQCSKRLDQLDVPHGVVMRGHWRNRPHEKVQVCSIQTLLRREAHDTDLYFIDEAHRALGNSYLEILKRSKDAKLIGLTATPIRTDGRGLGHLFDHIVPSLTPADLTEMGFLVPARVYAPSKPDLTGVHRQAGDYNQKELAERADTVKLIGDIVEHWHRLANGLSTVCFATSIKHSEHIVARFKAAGVPAEHIDGNTPVRDREAVLARVERGETLVVSNVGVWTEGVDVPCMTCAILARPTQSLALYLQMCVDSETEILAIDGWKSIGQINRDSLVASWDKSNRKIEWVRPDDVVFRPLADGERMFEARGQHLDIRVTGDHSMVYQCQSPTSKTWHTKTARECSEMRGTLRIPVTGSEYAPGVGLTDPELQFLGWFLSDGTLNRKNKAISISQSSDSPYIPELEECLRLCGFKYGKYLIKRSQHPGFKNGKDIYQFNISYGDPRGTGKHLRGWRDLEPFIDKNLSAALEQVNESQLGVLLAALNLGDGHKGKVVGYTPRTMRITAGNNKIFADRMQSLCIRRGFRCNVSTYTYNKSPLYTLHISKSKDSTVAGVGVADSNKRTRLLPAVAVAGEAVWCVATKHQTIITRRNGKVAILGNCGRILRPFEGKSEAIILDHAGCTLEHGFVTDDREWSLDGEVRSGKKGNDSGPAVRICLECYMAFPAASRTCPDCGWEYVPPQVNLVEGDGQLQEINETYKIRKLSKNAQIAYCQKIAEFMQYKPGWVYMQMKRIRGGEEPDIPDRARMLYDLQASA